MPITQTGTDSALHQAVDSFWEVIPAAWQQVRAQLREVSAIQHDITVEQFHILRHVRKGQGTVSEIAAAKRISRPAISQAVELLVGKGLITRRQDAHDRRCVRLELTPAGDALLNAIFQENRRWMSGRMAALSEAELQSLAAGMEALKKALIE
jgi:DNA-binding MarR family transcriptional regulator